MRAWRSTRLWRGALAVLIVAILILALSPVPEQELSTGWDKLNHFLAFSTLTFVGLQAFPGQWQRRWVLASSVAFGGLIELLQMLVPGRDSEWGDLLADSIGVCIGLFALIMVLRLIRAVSGRER